ncbi:hypothetical protein PC129_g12387 [Phytophthora cactorum]|uniref:Uncharacterized protein n=1 Tax=Phytophthora cactorum TaxID=29920 RepID=A0A329REN7_9STRA|nr:hypothetical protein PC112_g21183 [Phytophthora cactorum]KAG2798850.1 hypothetical protein PC111_g20677 [Phytophthora cactorum]KAG2909763.1 hypothetical protein PC115_g13151 [Phytophthora cactorum]KAG3216778.1 hypothetical protein PC129_g12387 [Phytophthora cactorum]RAW22469.1 hypothetical protein PC110_g21090 [Phytophthora cactorum]
MEMSFDPSMGRRALQTPEPGISVYIPVTEPVHFLRDQATGYLLTMDHG